MDQPLFQFELRPLAEVQPWGTPKDPSLSWFALSDGIWWINAGNHRLFEYSLHAVRELGASRYCDYQVVRLHDDLINLVPYALEDVPMQLVPCVELGSRERWSARWGRWMAALPDEGLSDADYSLIDSAGSWMGRRTLDSSYLSPSFDLRIWSSQGLVHLEWDNRTKLVDDGYAWTAVLGSYELPSARFLTEMQDFDERFMGAMAERVEQVCSGALEGRGIRVDRKALKREHVERSSWLQERLGDGPSQTNWESVVGAISALEERAR
jgi:hypothetical protein